MTDDEYGVSVVGAEILELTPRPGFVGGAMWPCERWCASVSVRERVIDISWASGRMASGI